MSSCGMGRCFTSDGVREFGSREYCMAQAMRDASDTDSSRSTASIYDREERGGGSSSDAQSPNLPLSSSSFSRCYIADKKLSVDLPSNVTAIQVTALAKLSRAIGALQQPLSGLQQSVSTSQRTTAALGKGVDALRENLSKMCQVSQERMQRAEPQSSEAAKKISFPSKAEIISCLENHPLTGKTTNPYLSEKGIIKAVAEFFDNRKESARNVTEFVGIILSNMTAIYGKLEDLSNTRRSIIALSLTAALKSCDTTAQCEDRLRMPPFL